MITLIHRASSFGEAIAIHSNHKDYTYQQLLKDSNNIALTLLQGNADLEGARIAFLVPSSYEYAVLQWGIWRAGGIAVPLCDKHPLESIKYILEDTQASVLLFTQEFQSLLSPVFETPSLRCLAVEQIDTAENGKLPDVPLDRSALILYTSGTTGLPKGVVTTHKNIEAQITALSTAWEWNAQDRILNVLPMHHVHGIINILSCALWNGACCHFLPKFDPSQIFKAFCNKGITLFMAVPTIYFKLIAHWKQYKEQDQEEISKHLKNFRLMVSGSAALPVSVLEEWRTISGHTLLERYGMTEMGMAISNPYRGERKPGYIGQALPGVSIRLADENDLMVAEGNPGEIQIKGANVFKEYWGKPKETQESFCEGGWFKSGDIAVYEEGAYKILGRNSVDIIKSGGYKISALEIEEVLRTHPDIKDCGVVGLPDPEWGEIIAAGLVPKDNTLDLEALKIWLKEFLPGYKTPRKYELLEELPRNVMGKVTKKELKHLFINE